MLHRFTLPLIVSASLALPLAAQTFDQDFEGLTAGVAPDQAVTGWSANNAGPVTSVTAVVTDDVGLVIDGSKSLLFTIATLPADVTDGEIGSYYSSVFDDPQENISPGTYQYSVSFRVLDPGVTASLRFFYDASDAVWASQTSAIALFSPSYTSASGTVSWTSEVFTVNPDNPNFFTGLQIQINHSGQPELSNVRLVIDSSTLIAVPEPASFASLAGLGVLGFALGARRRARR